MPDTPTAGREARPGREPTSTTRPPRLVGLDVARALAIVGMVAVNVGPVEPGGGTAAWLYRLPHGRASILFVLLAGIGFSLMTRRVRRQPTAGARRGMWVTLAWRGALLLLGGLALQLLPHGSNVILPVYAALFLVAGLLVTAPDRVLLAVASVVLVLGPVLWLGVQLRRDEPFTGHPPALGDPATDVVAGVLLTGPYPLVTWLAPFVLGIWLGRRNLAAGRTQRRLAVVAAAVAVATWAAGAVSATVRGDAVGDLSWQLLLTDAPHGQMPLWLLGSTALALLVLVGCLAVERRLGGSGHGGSGHGGAGHRHWWGPLAATGRLALTVYVGHLVALAAVRPLPHTLAQGVVISAVTCVVAVLAAVLWTSRFSRGPLEVLVRPPRAWLPADGHP